MTLDTLLGGASVRPVSDHATLHPMDDVVVVATRGELNAVTSPTLRERLTSEIEAGARAIVVDLSAVTFIDSSGLSALLAGLKRISARQGQLIVSGVSEHTRLIFELTQADRVFTMTSTVEHAMAKLHR